MKCFRIFGVNFLLLGIILESIKDVRFTNFLINKRSSKKFYLNNLLLLGIYSFYKY